MNILKKILSKLLNRKADKTMDTGKITKLFPKSPEGEKPLKVWMLDHRGHCKRIGSIVYTFTGDSYVLFYCLECEQFYVGDKLVKAKGA